MMIRRLRLLLIPLAAMLLRPAAAGGADLERMLRSRWHGAWVVLTTEVYSTCDAAYTDNRIFGTLVRPSGGLRFAPGEIGKVHKLNLRRKGVDLLVNLAEPFLISWVEGPFTLYDEAICKIELQLDLPRRTIRAGAVDAIEEALGSVVERYSSADEAAASPNRNARRAEPLPADYEETLAEYEIWKARQVNFEIERRVDDALEEADRIVRRVETDDEEYALGFVEGLEDGQDRYLGDCESLLSSTSPLSWDGRRSDRKEPRKRGYDDGFRLGRYLKLAHRLQDCRVPPALP